MGYPAPTEKLVEDGAPGVAFSKPFDSAILSAKMADNEEKEPSEYSAADYFLIDVDLGPVESVFTSLEQLSDGEIRSIGNVFSENLQAVYMTALAVWLFALGHGTVR